MRKGLIRSPYMPVRKTAPATPQNFTGYVLSGDEVAELVKKISTLHDELTGKVGQADSLLDSVNEHLDRSHKAVNRLTEVQDGIRFIQGKDGSDGRDGRDADEEKMVQRILAAIRQPIDGETPVVDYNRIVSDVRKLIEVKDGKDATVDYNRILNDVKEKLTIDHVPGLRGEIDSYRNQLAGKVYGEDTWARGGGDTVVQGTGVTIIPNANGQKVISATGGGGSTPLTPTGAVNGVNQVYVVVSRPSSVVADGITYYEGHGYSYSALQITMDSPPSQYIRYYA